MNKTNTTISHLLFKKIIEKQFISSVFIKDFKKTKHFIYPIIIICLFKVIFLHNYIHI